MSTRLLTLIGAAAAMALAPARSSAFEPIGDVAEKANQKLVKIFGAGGYRRLDNYGTGIIISPEGHILTAASPLLDTPDLVVHLFDGRRLKAQVLVLEPELDAAIIKIKMDGKKLNEPTGLDLPYFDILEAAKRPRAETGAWVLAISNTFEIALRDEPMSLQRGVVTAYTKLAGRRGVFDFPYTGEVYLVDAITNNPGAAGGALLNRKGELLGVIGREVRNIQSDTWMNYAIPVNAKVDIRVKELVKGQDGVQKEEEKTVTIKMTEFVARGMKGEYNPTKKENRSIGEGGYHGIVFVPNVIPRTPAYVDDVAPGSPAARCGLRPDDMVSFVDGEPVVSIAAFNEWIRKNTRPGSVIRLEVRRGETLQPIEMTLSAHPAKPKPPQPTPKKQ